jgi:hypothetical protein
MRLPRPRFTMQRLMFAVATVGIMLGLVTWFQRRAVAFRMAAAHHYQTWLDLAPVPSPDHPGPLKPLAWTEVRRDYQWSMFVKYDSAARSPWFPVESDPPEPE